MQGQAGHPVARALRAGIRELASPAKGKGAMRGRRGSLASVQSVWRRIAPGTNHIACFGVWRSGTRRQALRLNRAGTTRWHMPWRQKAVAAFDAATILEEIIPG